MIRKIISSGRAGVELAALDVAAKLGLTCGGWVQRGMYNNDTYGAEKQYGFKEVDAIGFRKAMAENVRGSDGTLLINRGKSTVESEYAEKTVLKYKRPFLHVDLSQYSAFESASLISSWSARNHVRVLFVTGPTDHQDTRIYRQVEKIIETAFYLGFVKTSLYPEHPEKQVYTSDFDPQLPQSVEEAVEQLKVALPLKDRALMANMQTDELDHLKTGLGEYIKQKFGLYKNNSVLMESCAKYGNLEQPLPDEACAVILGALWKNLKSTHKLRLIK